MTGNYSNLERGIARMVGAFPNAKSWLKRQHALVNFLLFGSKDRIRTSRKITPVKVGNQETFFGYYDVSPLSPDGHNILVHASSIPTTAQPNPKKPVQVCVVSADEQKLLASFPSSAYNWQQGTKAQWLNNTSFIYNDYDTQRSLFVSRLIDLENPDSVKTFDRPCYDIYKDTLYSLNFDRLEMLGGTYGYKRPNGKPPLDLTDLETDGIWTLDLNGGSADLRLTLRDIVRIDFKQEFDQAKHKVNHIMVSPNGKGLLFIHRYFLSGRRFDRLFWASNDLSVVKRMPTDGLASHCCWINDDEFIGYVNDLELGTHYFRFHVGSGTKELLAEDTLRGLGDGHPSVRDGMMIFDTYPDRSRMKKLLRYSLDKGSLELLAEFFEPLRYHGATRCDLHPKLASVGEDVFVDSVHEGYRCLYRIAGEE